MPMKKQKHSIRYNFIMNLILTGTQVLYPLITFTYAARIIGPQGIGDTSFAYTISIYFTSFAAIGLPTYGIRAFAQVRDDPNELSRTYQELMAISLITSSISYLVFFILLATVPHFKKIHSLLLISSLHVILTVLGTQWFYQGIEEYGHITMAGLVSRGIALIILFLFVRTKNDADAYMWSYVISQCGYAIINLAHIRKYVTFKRFDHYDFKRHLKPLFYFYFMSVSTTIMSWLDTTMLGFMCSSAETGYYNGAIKVTQVLTTISLVYGSVLMPRISNLAHRGEDKAATKLMSQSVEFLNVVSYPLIIFSFFFAPQIIHFLCGSNFDRSILILRYLLPSVLINATSNMMAYQILAPYGKEKNITISIFSGVIVDFVLNAILIHFFDGIGAAIATCVSELCVAVLDAYFCRSHLKDLLAVIKARYIPLSIITSILICLLVGLISVDGDLINLLVRGIIFVLIYFATMLVIKEPLATDFCRSITRKIFRKGDSRS